MTIQTYTLPKHDGTKYIVRGEAVTPVYCEEGYLSDGTTPQGFSVIKLGSGELVLYVYSKAIPRSNNSESVRMMHRNAQDMTTADVVAASGLFIGHTTHPVIKALGLPTDEVIE